ncbi:hypothetical protein ACFVRR_18375 [Gottfriedia sp. NPDC057948]|uniref:hypothetical protein n=1 Tax=Gottfriedia sp. NPDC057948 TaxID=3346287 RepID=UPI0036DD41B3
MENKNEKETYFTNKPTGTLPKRPKENSLLLNLNKKIKVEIDKIKKRINGCSL